MIGFRHIAPVVLSVLAVNAAWARSVPDVLAVLDQAGRPEAALEAAGLAPLPLPPARPSPFVPTVNGAAGLEETDLRLALMQLSLQAGTNDQLPLLNAQSDAVAPKALVLRSGRVNLAELGEMAVAQGLTGLVQDGETWRLTLPLVIWQGAALHMEPGESLVMERAAGSFLLNFGNLSLDHASLSGSEAPNERASDFRPFVLITGAGTLQLTGANLSKLGFGKGGSFGGLSMSNSGLFKPDFGPRISASSFTDVSRLSFDGSVDVRVEGSTLVASSLTLTGVNGAEIRSNEIDQGPGSAALILDEASLDIGLTGNLITRADGMGLLIDGLSRRIRLNGNVIDQSGGVGLNLRHSACVSASGNLIARSNSSAVRLTGAGRVWFAANALIANHSAGFDLIGQRTAEPVSLSANWLAANTVGLKGGEIGAVLLSGNDLKDQFPRQFAGGFAPHLPAYLSAAEGATRPTAFLIEDLRAGPVAADAKPIIEIRTGTNWPVECER